MKEMNADLGPNKAGLPIKPNRSESSRKQESEVALLIKEYELSFFFYYANSG